jgi:hypothetical protein
MELSHIHLRIAYHYFLSHFRCTESAIWKTTDSTFTQFQKTSLSDQNIRLTALRDLIDFMWIIAMINFESMIMALSNY